MATDVDGLEDGGGKGGRWRGGRGRRGWVDVLERSGVEDAGRTVDRGTRGEDGVVVHGGSGIGDRRKRVLVAGI